MILTNAVGDQRKMDFGDWLAVLGGALGAFMAILDIQVTNASIREISGALNLSFIESGWISTAYLVAEVIVIPLTAFFSQVFGIKRYLMFNAALFVFSSILCGCSWSLGSMILFRVLQGISGGTLIPMSFQLILLLMPEKQKALGLTIFGLTVTLAPSLGPAIGGWLTEEYSWRAIFFINIIPGIAMLTALNIGLPLTSINFLRLRRMDWISVFYLCIGLSGLTYFLEEGPKHEWFDSTAVRISFLMALIGVPLFSVRQFQVKYPILKLSLFASRNFALGTLITATASCALFSGIYGLSLYLGQVQDYAAKDIGLVLMWIGLPQLLIMPFLPILMRRVDLRILAIAGLGLFAYSNYLNSSLNLNVAGEDLTWSLWIRALGQPLFVIPLSSMAMSMVHTSEVAEASAIFNVMRNLGASIGIALTSTFLMKRQTTHFSQMTERLSSFDFSLVEHIYMTEQRLRGEGLSAAAARVLSLREVSTPVLRDSLIQSFSDIFFVLAGAIFVCALLVILMAKIKPREDETTGSH